MFRNDKPSVRNDGFYRFCCFSFFRDFYPILFAPFMIRSEFIESLKSFVHSLSHIHTQYRHRGLMFYISFFPAKMKKSDQSRIFSLFGGCLFGITLMRQPVLVFISSQLLSPAIVVFSVNGTSGRTSPSAIRSKHGSNAGQRRSKQYEPEGRFVVIARGHRR